MRASALVDALPKGEPVTADELRSVALAQGVSVERWDVVLIRTGLLRYWPDPQQLAEELKKQGFRAASDLRDDKIGYKIRSLALQKLPYICVVGDKEVQAGTVAVRARGGVDLGAMSLAAFCERLRLEVEQRSNSPVAQAVTPKVARGN